MNNILHFPISNFARVFAAQVRNAAYFAAILSTAACATPTVTLENHKSGQVQTCGGGTAGSLMGGMIGYSIQRDSDTKCIDSLKQKGFKVEDVK